MKTKIKNQRKPIIKSSFLAPKEFIKLEDTEKRVKRKINKNKKRVHVYWKEEEMVDIYNKIIEKRAKKEDLDYFWSIIDILIDKVFKSYSSIRYYYRKEDSETVEDAKGKIKEELFKALFIKKNWNKEKGKLFTFVTVVVKNWFIYYSIINFRDNVLPYEKLADHDSRDNENQEEFYTNNLNSQELLNFDYQVFQEKEYFKKETNELFFEIRKALIDKVEEESQKKIIDLFFECIFSDELFFNQKFIRDVYNIIRFSEKKKRIKEKSLSKKERYLKFSSYFIPYLKRKLTSQEKKLYNLKTTEDYLGIIFKSLDIIEKELKQRKIIRN